MPRYEIISEDENIRIDKFIKIEGITRQNLQNLIEEGKVTVNHNAVNKKYQVAFGDKIVVEVPEPKEADIKAQNIPLDIFYEDDDLLVVNKPQGMVVHPAAGNYEDTLVNALMYHCGDNLSGINGVMRPGIIHRIDKNTSGLLLIAKSNLAHLDLSEQIKNKSVKREYVAIAEGVIPNDKLKIDAPIGRHQTERKKMCVTNKNSKNAVTHFEVLKRYSDYTFIKCRLETGRTHQIRVHLKYFNHPILGDDVYGKISKEFPHLKGQTLHAKLIGFIHPRTKEYMEFEAPLPEWFEDILTHLENKQKEL